MFSQEDILRLRNELTKAQTIGIIVRDNPDIDAMAAALSLYLSLFSFSQGTKHVSICCKTDPIVELSSLVGIDKVKKTFEGGGDLTISLPYREGTIEKISYNIEGERINLLIKAAEQRFPFEPSDISYTRSSGALDLLLNIGIGQRSLVEEFTPLVSVSIDNSPSNEQFGTIILVDPSASSISELTASLISSLTLPIDIDIAQNLLSGISFATDNFQRENASPLSFEMASILLRHGARRDGFFAKAPKALFGEVGDFSSPIQQSPKRDEKGKKRQGQEPPSEWLTPKIYKGSTTV